MTTPPISTRHPIAVTLKTTSDHQAIEEGVKSDILRSALAHLQGKPGFNPAALSIVFGLKW